MNEHSKAAGHGVVRKFAKKTVSSRFSPSYGVRRGLIKDPNWPPAHFPEEGTASARRSRRFECSFQVKVGKEVLDVKGDLSLGGVKFDAPVALQGLTVEVLFNGMSATAEVIGSQLKGDEYTCRAKFVDPAQSTPMWNWLFERV